MEYKATDLAALQSRAEKLLPQIISWRRDLHAMPELKMDTPKTEAYIVDALRRMGIGEIQSGIGGHGVCALIRGELPGKCLAIRADCDGLPIREETGLPFASQNGNMHACGHDAHTAMGLGAAMLLLENRHLLRGSVKLIFQPYEEGDRGASMMLEAGVLEAPYVDAVIALHNHCTPDDSYAPGDVLIHEQATSAAIYAYEAVFHGPGAHVCLSRKTPNPVYMACEAVSRIGSLPEPGPETVNAVTVVRGGERNNIVPDSCTIAGSIRAFDARYHQTMRQQVEQIIRKAAADHGGTVDFKTTIDLMETKIDRVLLEKFRRTATALDPERGVQTVRNRELIGEDFARFADRVPGLYFFLHTRPEGSCYPLHNPKFDVNESVLHKGSALFAAFALQWQEP